MTSEMSDFIRGFSESIINNIGIQHKIDIEKSKKKLFITVISIAIISTGIFTTIWGIASYIDHIFDMQGIGFVIVGIMVILIGILYNRRQL